MNKVKSIVLMALMAPMSNGYAMNAQGAQKLAIEHEKNEKSVSRQVAYKGLGYAVAGTALRGIGHAFHKASGAPDYEFSRVPFDPEFNTLVKYPQYYSRSMVKHYSSKVARALLTASSVVHAPLRSAVASVTMPVGLVREYIKTSHALKNPNIDRDRYHSYSVRLGDLKTEGVRSVLRAPRAALVGFVPVAAYAAYKNRQQEQQND